LLFTGPAFAADLPLKAPPMVPCANPLLRNAIPFLGFSVRFAAMV